MKTFIENLEFVGRHGLYDEERRDGRRFSVDLSVTLSHAPVDDNEINSVLDYRNLAGVILRHGEGRSVNLIEHLGGLIINDLFALSPRITHVDLRIRKQATGVPGAPQWVGCHFEHHRDEWDPSMYGIL